MNPLFDITDELRAATLHDLESRKSKNAQFSLRSFARSIDVQASFLSKFINGKTILTKERAKELIDKIALDERRRIELLSKLDLNNPLDREMLVEKNYYILSDPIYYNFLCLIETKDFEFDVDSVAKLLNCSADRLKAVIHDLLALQFIAITEDGSIKLSTPHLVTADGIPNLLLRNRHKNNLTYAMTVVDQVDIKDIFFGFETIAINKSQLSQFKLIANEFFEKVINLSNTSREKDSVYEFNLNFYPRVIDENKNANEFN